MKNLVSIVLPTYNGEKYINSAIDSIIGQTYKNWELIIVNDCSTDGTLDIINNYALKDSRIKVINNKKNLKLPASLNEGFSVANGEYLTWTSDDNFYNPCAIYEMVKYLDENKADAMVCANFTKINEFNVEIEKMQLSVSAQNIIMGNCVGACFLYRKEIAQKVGNYNIDKFLVEDYDYWLRVMLVGNIGHIDMDLYTYRLHNNSLTGQRMEEIITKTNQLIEEYLPLYEKKFKDLKIKKSKLSLLEKIFSIKNEGNKKVLRIFGIKIKFKRKLKNNPTNTDDCSIRLSSQEWGELYNISQLENLCNSLNDNNLSVQTQEILNITQNGMKTLEIGSGSGQSSLLLAKNGRFATALDYEQKCLDLTCEAAKKLNLQVNTVLCDAFKENPFNDNEFDVIFHSGLLEHFSMDERINFLKLWRRSCKTMVSMVPNAASLAYRTGKAIMEKNGSWAYGLEMPLYTQIPDFTSAGYTVKAEYTIGAQHALNFLDDSNELKKNIQNWLKEGVTDDDCHQGYLLVTIGESK